jgi:hypothetical protein
MMWRDQFPPKLSRLETVPMKSKRIATGLGSLQLFVGVGAVGGGLALILEPSGAKLGIPQNLLENSPFSTYLVPGVVLFAVNGFGSLAGAAATFMRCRYSGEAAVALGAVLVSWIMLQVYWIAAFHWIHALYLGLGVAELILGLMQKRLLEKT